MTTRTYGILAGVIGSALGAWWWRHRRSASPESPEHGAVIYDNTPMASALSGEGVI